MANRMMRMSSDGMKMVQSPEFASLIMDFMLELRKNGQTEKGARIAATSLIAWVASGHDIDRAPSEEELEQLADFMNKNSEQIGVFADQCLKNLLAKDTYGTVH